MNLADLSEVVFLQEVEDAGQVWVARGVWKNIYAQEMNETEYSLPVWSNRERVEEFLRNARPVGQKYEPQAIPLDVFTNAWLSDKMMAISELQINPDGKTTRVLVVSAEEFKSTQAVK
jgi:hypothetical protein